MATAAMTAAVPNALSYYADVVDTTLLIPILECDACGKSGAAVKCGRCRCAYYCSKDCMRGHWETHNRNCIDCHEAQSERLKPKVPLRRVASGRGMPCGICKNMGKDGVDPIVLAECNHAFCLVCLKASIHSQHNSCSNREDNEEDTDEDESKECRCPSCQKTILNTTAETVEEIPVRIAEHYVEVAERKETGAADRSELIRAAVAELRKVVHGYQVMVLASSTKMGDTTAAAAAAAPPVLLSRNSAFAAHVRIAELHLLLGDTANALNELDAVTRDETKLQLQALERCISEFTDQDDPQEKDAVIRLWRTTRDHGLVLALPHWIATNEATVMKRIYRIVMTKGKAYESMQDWLAAEREYLSLWCHHSPVDLEGFSSKEVVSLRLLLLCCSIKLGSVTAEELSAQHVLPLARRQTGIYREFASALQFVGEVERAREFLRRAFAYEAPWDIGNAKKNVDTYLELCTEILAQEERRKQEEDFYNVWGEVLELVESSCSTEERAISWKSIKDKEYDMVAADSDDDDDSESGLDEYCTTQKVRAAQEAGLSAEADASESEVLYGASDFPLEGAPTVPALSGSNGADVVDSKQYDGIKLTKEALKNVNNLDPKYREFFIRRVEELASGRRSRIMAKGLEGCRHGRIFETYLEQKSGHRILWTADDDDGLVIWYVAKHKKVSKFMKMIDEADERGSRRLTSASSLLENATGMDVDGQTHKICSDRVFLDPFSDTPLKVYDIPRDQLQKLESPKWKPRLHLTKQEKSIVEMKGTVLLLGRSGTGKTVCICERIARDRHQAEVGGKFSQLFVARSRGICEIVSSLVGSEYDEFDQHLRSVEYLTFTKLINKFKETLQQADDPLFFNDLGRRVDFLRFKRDFAWVSDYGVDALVVWTQILSFIKGSVEALLVDGSKYLGLQNYLDMEVFSAARCRLPELQRKKAYAAFQRYESEKSQKRLWDDCDLVAFLHGRLEAATTELGSIPADLLFDRVYVDEVQDYTQQEIALFFKLCKPGHLFLAGDPAQSVVEGVEFRFEEIRSVVYKLLPVSLGTKRQRYVPEKPKKVTVNFRSHSGILNVAAEVLEVLFRCFPNSAPDLGKDCGVFQGPRPGLFENIAEQRLKELVSRIDGVYLLTRREEDVERLKKLVGSKQFVLSIRDSKGLEFSDVILVDFFKGLSAEHQKPWRDLLRDGGDISNYQNFYPEIETHLKHLYTAITRCKMRFFIAETGDSDAGNAFFKWLCNKNLASKQRVDDVEKMVMTRDQWITTGMEHATHGESLEDFAEAQAWLGRAAVCFENAEDPDLQRKVGVNLDSIRFREVLYYKKPEDDALSADGGKADYETRAVTLLAQLAKEGLLEEAQRVCASFIPLLGEYARTGLNQRLIPLLPAADD